MYAELRTQLWKVLRIDNVKRENYKFFMLVSVGSVVGLIGHISFIFLFFYLGLTLLAIFNIFSCICWIIIIIINCRGYHNTAVAIGTTEVVVHAILATFYLGWNSGFHLYILGLVPFIFFSQKWNNAFKIILSVFLCITYISINMYSQVIGSHIAYHQQTLNLLNGLNIVITFIIFASFAYQYKTAASRYEDALREANGKLEELARTDSLTGLLNRRCIMEKIEYELMRSVEKGNPFSVIICDIDNFKSFNDKYGHDCGDFILMKLADTLKGLLRKQDHISRWGGEEFLLILPETVIEEGKIIAERIRKEIESRYFVYDGRELSVTMTFGISVCNHEDDVEECIKSADRALLEGKREGKNRVIF